MGFSGRIRVNWLLYVTVLSGQFLKGYFLVMISEGQKYDMAEGETLNLVCDFQADNYNLFDYPVLWKKSQHHEDYQINIMGNLNQPFVDTKRFGVSYTKSPPTHRLELIINNVVAEDSGNYTCEVRGPQSKVLTSVMHHVYIRAPVKSLVMTAGNYSGDHNVQQDESSRHSRRVTMIENTHNPLKCVAYGGYPAPELKIKLGKKDITPEFYQVTRPKLSGQPGLRVITYTTEVWTDSFMPDALDDDSRVKCVASISGLRSNTTAIKLDVHYSPKIKCHPLSVEVWERNPVLRCEIHAKPDITTLSWIVDKNGTTIEEGDVINGFWMLIPDRTPTYVEAQLFMRQARPENFGTYTIIAENSVAAATQDVELFQKIPPTTQRPPYERESQSRKSTFNSYVVFNHGAPSPRISQPTGYLFHVIWIYSIWRLLQTLSSQR